MRNTLQHKIISSLEKCFTDESISQKPALTAASVMRGEQLSFQLAYIETGADRLHAYRASLEIGGPLAQHVTVRRVVNIPSQLATYPNDDDNYIRKEPGLYPDLLAPLDYAGRVNIVPKQLRAIWLSFEPSADLPAGTYPITLKLTDEFGEEIGEESLTVTLYDTLLPEQDLILTQWFYCDCLAQYYRVEVFSEEHWRIIENFVCTAVKNGINLILTPTFTPALDTSIGGERLTTQLVGVTCTNGEYSFDFTLLDRWIEMCNRCGVKYFEVAHFFTQWGAGHAPKVMATVDGEYRRIFGWETDATGEEYSRFLRTFVTAFLAHMKARGDDKRCFFHISDEPQTEHLEQYRASKAVVEDLLEGYVIMDALSNYAFYSQGIVKTPIPANDHIKPFLEAEVPNLWTYYCCAQHKNVSNRFFAMPSARNRIIGVQMYKYNIVGFLQWGYNFYNNRHSYEPLNPFLDSNGSDWVPSGDTYSVYPAPDGTAWESLRILVFREAIADMRALKLCESLYGREYVLNLIDSELDTPITFDEYPRDAAYILNLREKVNAAIAAKA